MGFSLCFVQFADIYIINFRYNKYTLLTYLIYLYLENNLKINSKIGVLNNDIS